MKTLKLFDKYEIKLNKNKNQIKSQNKFQNELIRLYKKS